MKPLRYTILNNYYKGTHRGTHIQSVYVMKRIQKWGGECLMKTFSAKITRVILIEPRVHNIVGGEYPTTVLPVQTHKVKFMT